MKANHMLTTILLLGLSFAGYSQTMVLVKAFDENMKAIEDLEFALDEGDFYRTSNNGSIYIDIAEQLLPPKTIIIKDQTVEAESWNYSKGILEVMVRKKSYQMTTIYLKDRAGNGLSGLTLQLQTPEAINKRSASDGAVRIPIPLTVNTQTTKLFQVPGYTIKNRKKQRDQLNLYLEPILVAKPSQPLKINEPFALSELDSIRSLTVFYTFIKYIDIQKLNQELRNNIDAKFYELLSQRSDSLGYQALENSMGKISDSSFVTEDISLLIAHALWEEQNLGEIKTEFDQKIALINSKLVDGGANLDFASREDMVSKIEQLDRILTANSKYFSNSTSDYHQILLAMKNRLLNIKDLEEKLTSVENQRLQEKKTFQDQLFTISLVVLGLAIFSFALLLLLRKINKQKKQIDRSRQEINKVNEHLEELVDRRTQMLQKTNEELDTFMYRASHDLRRPITSLLGLMQVAKMTLGKEAMELCERVGTTARSMDSMLRKLIMVSHINHPCQPAMVNIDEMFQKHNDEFQTFTNKHNIDLVWNDEVNNSLKSCPVMLDIILSNLVENALRFSAANNLQPNPRVVVNASRIENELIIEVEDKAGGIDPEVQPKIWNMFYVGHVKSQGNGLGLFITRRAVDKLGADISFSCDQEGTTFRVSIPTIKLEDSEMVAELVTA